MAHILIVEDEQPINDLISMNLTMVGHTTVQAYDTREAAEKMRNHHFDLCLLDVMLPGQDGFQSIDLFKNSQIPGYLSYCKNFSPGPGERTESGCRGLYHETL